jgi:HK97 family phage portal protein
MEIFGLVITRKKELQPVDSRGGWSPLVREPFAGAWQRGIEFKRDDVLAFSAVHACVTGIASDVGKLRLMLKKRDAAGLWRETETGSPWLPVLRKPNRYQTRVQFFEHWMISRLTHGNTYALKERDRRGVVVALYLLAPERVTPLVAPDGSIFYQLGQDNLSGLESEVTVSASEIIHDRGPTLHHPLVGVSPLQACGWSATLGGKIARGSAEFFANGAKPGGILTAPGAISQETADRLKEAWETKFTGANTGKIAILGDGLKYEAMTVTATDAQLIEQLRWSAEDVARAFRMPAHMIGAGPVPNYATVEQLSSAYYSQTLQALLESIEAVLVDGLELPAGVAVEFDTKELLRMDTSARYKAHSDAIAGGWLAPNEARAQEGLPAVDGGDTPYLQQQNWALGALAARRAPADMEPGQKLGEGALIIKQATEQATRQRARWNHAVGDWDLVGAAA